MEYDPSADATRFFLNTRAPADANGTISSISYCFIRDRSVAVRLYRATVGFYRRHGNTFKLTYAFNITMNDTKTFQDSQDQFQCKDMSIDRVEVRQGEIIGFCSRFFDKSTGRIILVAKGIDSDSLFKNGIDDRDNFCYTEGSVPREFTRDEIGEESRQILLLYANITNP